MRVSQHFSSRFCSRSIFLILSIQLSGALWLAEYLKREMEILRPLPYCDAVSRRDETQTLQPIINKPFVASSGDIITDYIDLYCLSTVNITMSAFVISETTNNKHYSTRLKTSVWIIRSRDVLTGRVRSTRLFLRSWNCSTL